MAALLITFGILLLLISWIYLLIVSFKDDFTWGLTTMFLPPLSYAYCFAALEKTGSIVVLALIGWGLIFLGL